MALAAASALTLLLPQIRQPPGFSVDIHHLLAPFFIELADAPPDGRGLKVSLEGAHTLHGFIGDAVGVIDSSGFVRGLEALVELIEVVGELLSDAVFLVQFDTCTTFPRQRMV